MAKLGTDGEDVNAQATGSAKAPLAFAPRGSIEERYRPARRGGGAGAGGAHPRNFPNQDFRTGRANARPTSKSRARYVSLLAKHIGGKRSAVMYRY